MTVKYWCFAIIYSEITSLSLSDHNVRGAFAKVFTSIFSALFEYVGIYILFASLWILPALLMCSTIFAVRYCFVSCQRHRSIFALVESRYYISMLLLDAFAFCGGIYLLYFYFHGYIRQQLDAYEFDYLILASLTAALFILPIAIAIYLLIKRKLDEKIIFPPIKILYRTASVEANKKSDWENFKYHTAIVCIAFLPPLIGILIETRFNPALVAWCIAILGIAYFNAMNKIILLATIEFSPYSVMRIPIWEEK